MTIREQNAEVIQSELELQELTARVFKGASESDMDAWLTVFGEFCGAFSRHENENQFSATIVAGRRQAFYWVADHLRLPLAVCYPRYLRPIPTQPETGE